jgi:hypothetical protein
VALLAGGVIAATGSHRELMAAQPAYAALMSPAGFRQREREEPAGFRRQEKGVRQ